MSLEIEVVPFDGHLSRADFDCGVEPLNQWLRQQARQQQEAGTSRTFLAIPKKGTLAAWHAAGFEFVEESTVLGYFSLSSAQVTSNDLPPAAKLPRNVPVVRLGRLAVHRRLKRRGFGTLLLMEALVRAAQASEIIGVTGLFVDAKHDALQFYQQFGFQQAEDDPLKLWLPMHNVIAILNG